MTADVQPRLVIPGLRCAPSRLLVGVGTTYNFSDVLSAGLAYNTEVIHLDDFNYNRAVLDIPFRF
jgi:hypothetical protein